MEGLEELLELTEFLEKEIKDVNMNDISQVISFIKKYIDCQNKIINAFKENYDEKTIELSKYKKALDIIKIKKIDVFELKFSYSVIEYNLMARNSDFDELTKEQYELLKEVLGNEN